MNTSPHANAATPSLTRSAAIHWDIQRLWVIHQIKGANSQASTGELKGYRACAMLGAAGLGKTYEMRCLAAEETRLGFDVRFKRLVELGTSVESLESGLRLISAGATTNTVIYLDALDEVMIPVKTAGLIIGRWIQEAATTTDPALRISCRSAVWPPSVGEAMHGVYGNENCALALLQALFPDDIQRIATAHGINAEGFLSSVEAAGATVLSQQPLTLQMLLRIYAEHRALPTKRSELFAQAVALLAADRSERFDAGTANEVTCAEIQEAAERLACFLLLSGSDAVDLGDSPLPSHLGRVELGGLPGGDRPLDDALLRALGRSGLCEGDGSRRFRFAHRQLAEYLAGRRLAKLLPHQARALLASANGWQAGAAGPLRETASFTAMESEGIAEWLTEYDPEVIGLSDVTDEALRRRATLNLLEKFRRHELTDSQVGHGEIELAGFRYAGAEQDLRPVLRERGPDCHDVLECAVELIEAWELSSMSDDLAELILDADAPHSARTAAGAALAKIGTADARARLLPLISQDDPADPELELKGLALRCNWPDRIAVPRLFEVLTPPVNSSYHGWYVGFLSSLDFDEFDAQGHALAGLVWARRFIGDRNDYQSTVRIANRIAIRALEDIDVPAVADALADLMIEAAESYSASPFQRPRRLTLEREEPQEETPVLAGREEVRRKLLDALAAKTSKDRDLWWAARHTPALLLPEDFAWLIQRATCTEFPMPQRESYAELARMLPWYESVPAIEAWLAAREIEPIASRIQMPLSVELAAPEADKMRKAHAEMKRWNRPERRKKVKPSPPERITQMLTLSETKDPRFFLNICQELTLEEYSTHYDLAQRFLTKTPGWIAAKPDTQNRIVRSAQRLLVTETDAPEKSRSYPLNSILYGYMQAFWLLMECDLAWLEDRAPEWWQRWAFYILRELRPNMSGEPEEPKRALLALAFSRAGEQVRVEIESLAISIESEQRELLSALLRPLHLIQDSELNARLTARLSARQIPEDRVRRVAQFLLSRDRFLTEPACLALVNAAAVAQADSSAVEAAIALLSERSSRGWNSVMEMLERRPDLRRRILTEFASGRRFGGRDENSEENEHLTCAQAGQLVRFLIEIFPPESDPQHNGAHWCGPEDEAMSLRNRLINWLGDQAHFDAVRSLVALEQRFGKRYPWLRRPRARAERLYRLSHWRPVPLKTVADILTNGRKRLLRSGVDTLDGIVAALEQYEYELRHSSPSDLEDLWNRPRRGRASPKEEERVSDKLCVAIRQYFQEYCVTADREVQITRRTVPAAAGGAPGSELDVLFRAPAAAVAIGDPIAIPVEVKLSHNPEVRTALRDQLVNRYMSELGTSCGVFVVAWMPAPGCRPCWKSLECARSELNHQAKAAITDLTGADIRCVVIDASLPLRLSGTRSKPSRSRSKPEQTSRKANESSFAAGQQAKPSSDTSLRKQKKRPRKPAKASKKKPRRRGR